MHRVLRPGGRLAILEFAIPPRPVVRAVYLWYFNQRAAADRPAGLAPQRRLRRICRRRSARSPRRTNS